MNYKSPLLNPKIIFCHNLNRWVMLILLIPMFSCSSSKKLADEEEPPAFDFMFEDQSLGDVIERATQEDKLIFVDIHAEWCLPCQMMDEEVFSDRKLGKFFNENFINYKVDGEKGFGPDIAYLYDIRAYPTLLFLDRNGRVIEKKEGTAFYHEMMRLANNSLESENAGKKKAPQ